MYSAYQRAGGDEGRRGYATGWLPSMPSRKDYDETNPEIVKATARLNVKRVSKKLASAVDLRPWCSPIEDQGSIGSCTAHAAVGIVEYFERRAFDHGIDGSRLFVYKTTRNLMGVTGDTGAWLRSAMGALALCGVPDERYWPYTDSETQFDREPTSFVYSVADDYQAIRYFSHDPVGGNAKGADVLHSVKKYLAVKVPSMFGFWGFGSSEASDVPGAIPFPCAGEKAKWGHAVVAIGYDDRIKITNTKCNKSTTGALLIRNSWGASWGDKGYGWLPYDYVLHRYADDFWSLLSMEWVSTKGFDFDA